MILTIESDTAFLVAPGAKSRAAGYHYLSNKNNTIINGSIQVLTKIAKVVLSSAAEAEIAAIYMNARLAIPMRITLEELGHKQPPTTIRTDNSTALGVLTGTVKQQRSRVMDMRWYWVKDRIEQGQFKLLWAPGNTNFADYYSKHHSPTHHRITRPIWLHESNSPTDMQGCIKILQSRDSRLKSP